MNSAGLDIGISLDGMTILPCPPAPMDCQVATRELEHKKTLRAELDVADAAYKRPPPETVANPDGSVKTLVSSPEDLRAAGLDPADLQIKDTNFGAVVYKEGEPPRYTVSFRGTEEWVGKDGLGSDMKASKDQALYEGKDGETPPAYYSQAQIIAQKLKLRSEQLGTPSPHFVGHSLGGGLASAAAASTGSTATTYNAAGLNPKTIPKGLDPANAKNIEAVYVRGEALTETQQWTSLHKAFGTPVPLDPPVHVGRDILMPLVGVGVGGLLGGGVGAILGKTVAKAIRAAHLHTVGALKDSLDDAVAGAEAQKRVSCG